MEHSAPAVFEIGLVLLIAAAAGWGARRVGLPAVMGYLAAGLAISPFTPGYTANREQLQLLADVGVVLLLFEVGIELDINRLRREQGALAWAAPVQVVVTTVVAGAVASMLGVAPVGAAIVGLSVALSSGVVIVNITKSRRRTTDRRTDEALLGWSAVQDVVGVAIGAVLVGLLGVADRSIPESLVLLAIFFALAIAAARLLPRVLGHIRADHDLFLIVSVASGLTIAGVGSLFFGVPLALAAFVAGLAISDSPDSSEARRRLAPFRDLFAILFFVALGTLVDPSLLPASLPWIGVLLVLVVVSKTVVAYLLARLGRLPARRLQLAVGLSQMGEFSFVLASAALAAEAIAPEVYVALLGAVIVSISASAILVRLVGQPRAAPAAAT